MSSSSRGSGATGRARGEGMPSELLRAVVHEVGNLLAAVRLSAHLAAGERAEAERAPLVSDIEDLAAHAGALLAQIRPLAAGGASHRVEVPTAELLGGLRSALADRAPSGARLEIASGRGLPAVRGEPDALHYALLALVYGAVEAARPGGRVRVAAAREGRRVEIALLDDGRALDLAAVRRGPPPRGRELAIRLADAVLRRMGGRVRAEARPRGGTRVSVLLPAVLRRGARGARGS